MMILIILPVFNAVLAELLDQAITAQLLIPENEVFPMKPCKISDSALKGHKLPAFHTLGVKMVVRLVLNLYRYRKGT